MKLLRMILTTHICHWGIPHRLEDEDKTLIQTCYECGKTRNVKVSL